MSLSKDCSTNIHPFLKTTEKTEEKSFRFPPITTRGSRGRPKKFPLEFPPNDVFNEMFEEKNRRFSSMRTFVSWRATVQSDSLGKISLSTNISHALEVKCTAGQIESLKWVKIENLFRNQSRSTKRNFPPKAFFVTIALWSSKRRNKPSGSRDLSPSNLSHARRRHARMSRNFCPSEERNFRNRGCLFIFNLIKPSGDIFKCEWKKCFGVKFVEIWGKFAEIFIWRIASIRFRISMMGERKF